MKKLKKITAGIMTATIIASINSICASAESMNVAWKLNYNNDVHAKSDIVTCYEDGSCERFITRFARIIVTVPENVTPDTEYFGVSRISDVCKFDKVCYYNGISGEEVWSEIEPKDNEYILDIYLDGAMTVVELEEECTEIAKKLISEGKIESARTYDIVTKYSVDSIGGINITTDGSVSELDSVEFGGLLGNVEKITDNSFSLIDTITEAEEMVEVMSVCNSLMENYDYITEASPIIPELPLISSGTMYGTDYIYMWGDADRNNSLDLYDAIEISKHIMGIGELDEDTILLTDINRDGVTNLYDAVEIAKSLM